MVTVKFFIYCRKNMVLSSVRRCIAMLVKEEQPVGKRRARCSHRLLHALYDHHKEGGEEMR